LSANKRKILENAQKYLQRGQLDKALKEFQAALQADPRDTGTRLKIGDLHLKQGNKDEAVVAYLKVADQFMKDGFDARAVALYKQILKIDAARADVHVPLAELYTRLGLTSDAMASLQTAADAYHREGRKRDALELLRKMARLDPANTTSRLKIAELLQQAGMKDEALAELDEVAREVERIADAEEMKRVYERLLELDPSRHAAHVGIGRIALERADFRAAETHARQALELRADGPDGLQLIADVLRAAGREDELQPIYRRLADVYRERGDEDRAREILQRYVSSGGLELGAEGSQDLDGGLGADFGANASPFGEAGDAGLLDDEVLDDEAVLDEAPAIAPPPVAAAPPAAPPPPAPDVDPDQLVAEANVYLRYGKAEKAIASLESAIAAAPGHRGALTKLAEVMEQRGESERAASLRARSGSTPGETRPAASAPQRSAPTPLSDDEDLGELTFTAKPRASAPAAKPAAPEESGPLDLDVDFEVDAGEAPAALGPSSAAPARKPSLLEEPPVSSLPEPGLDEMPESDLEVDLDLDLDDDEGAAAAPGASARSAAEPTVTGSGSSTSTAVQIVEDLEEAEFYFHQSLLEEAEAVYRRVLTVAPNHPQAMLRLGEIDAARGGSPETTQKRVAVPAPKPVAADTPKPVADEAAKPAVTTPAPAPPTPPKPAVAAPAPAVESEEESFDLAGELGLDDSAEVSPGEPGEDTSTQPSVSSAALEPDADFDIDLDDSSLPASDGAGPELDAPSLAEVSPPSTAAALRGLATTRPVVLDGAPEAEAFEARDGAVEGGAISEAPTAEAPARAAAAEPAHAEFDLAAELSDAFADANASDQAPGAKDRRFDEGFHAVFDEFKRGVKRVVGEGDFETHFDLGIAYREMGLLEDAVGEFVQAVGSPTRRLAALHMMGLCALDLKRPDDAIAHLEQALSLPDVPPDQRCALHSDLARGFLALGDATRARDAIERAAATDARFPELAKRRLELEALESGAPLAEAESAPAEPFESFDDLIAEARSETEASASAPEAEPETDARAATTGAETPAPPAPSPAPTPAGRRRKISFL
jgi:tetratricopeptide (TPR) repeat protein